jgi:surface antigen
MIVEFSCVPPPYSAQTSRRKAAGWVSRVKIIAATPLIAWHCAACAVILPLDSLQVDQETTQSVPAPGNALSPNFGDEDWRRAQAALSLAVDPQGPGQPVNWDNPASKKRGTFAAGGNLTLRDNTVCRRFTSILIDHSKPAAPQETRHEGQACRLGPSEWTMRDVRPLGDSGTKGKMQPMPLATSAFPTG